MRAISPSANRSGGLRPEQRAASQPCGRSSHIAGAALELVPAADLLPPFEGPRESLIEQAADNGRAYRIEVRPGFTEGQYLGLALRMWGDGHWCVRDGQPHHYTDRVHARRAAQRWMESGR